MKSEARLAPHPTLPRYYNAPEERQQRVNAMFDASASHYDLVTHLQPHRWRSGVASADFEAPSRVRWGGDLSSGHSVPGSTR